MKHVRHISGWLGSCFLAVVCLLNGPAAAQTCFTGADVDAPLRSSIERAAQQYLSMAQRGDYTGLRSSAIPSLASNFAAIESAVGEHLKDLQGQSTISGFFVLDASLSSGTLPRAEFDCGIFNSPGRVIFVIPNLPAGRYAVVTESVSSGNTPANLTFVLQQAGSNWQVAGLTISPQSIGGHDSNWYWTQARSYRQGGANMAAYLYYLEAWNLAAPVTFQYTAARDKIADEMQAAQPANLPSPQSPLMLTAPGKTYRITNIFAEAAGNDLDIIVKYQALSDLSNTAAAFADNTAVIKALLAQYPELRNAFAAVVARAVAPNGKDYGTILAMKDVK
jgi:hypothetical protein